MIPRRDLGGRLWAITCLFNPAGFQRRIANFRTFRERLGVPLVAAELAWDGQFALVEGDADVLIRVCEGDRMWQKERLLNLALAKLPEHCDQVMWIDADVACPDHDWVNTISQSLEDVKAVQAFTTVHHLSQDGVRTSSGSSMVSALSGCQTLGGLLNASLDRASLAPCSGHVWAARKSALQSHGFYDGCVVGGGDTAFLCAAIGEPAAAIRAHGMGARQAQRYLEWSERVFAEVKGSVEALRIDIEHLWHGRLEDRKARERHRILSDNQFDPYTDIAMTESGTWRWNSDKPELHQAVGDYFASRNEDGLTAGTLVS